MAKQITGLPAATAAADSDLIVMRDSSAGADKKITKSDFLGVTDTGQGWLALGETLTYESNDGNKQATYTVSGTDVTGTVQEGMKVKLPRVTTVGTQCADLEASSSQYASKASPSGCTFTDDFTCGGWIKAESIDPTANDIISRYNTTSGFGFRLLGGTIDIFGKGSGTTDRAESYQSVPVGEWVHVVGTIDLSGASGKIYINGIEVSSDYTNAAVTAITQAGDLELGSSDGGSNPFDGKIKHAFVADKVLSEAEVKEAMVSDALETSSFSANLVAYYKLEGDFTDDSGNSNDLTAQNSAVATDTDSPFSSTEYGIITSATFSTDTTVEVDFGSKVPVNENVTAPAYSTHQIPYGLPRGAFDLLSILSDTGIAGNIATGINAGAGGGDTNYVNIGGLKICWGKTDQSGSIATNGTASRTVTLPVTYDSAPYAVNVVTSIAVDNRLGSSVTSTTTTTLNQQVVSMGAGPTAKGALFWLTIGV